jgi:hypothetical protein
MARTPRQSSLDQPAYAVWVIVAGLFAVLGIAVVAIIKYDNATDVVTVLGSITGVIAALVGAYFGVRGATLAQQKANEAHDQPPVVTPENPTPVAGDGQVPPSGVIAEAPRSETAPPR